MTFDSDDPRLTAFALGELDESERPTVEALVAQSDDARRLVEEVQALAHLLSDQLKTEPSPMLFPGQRQAIQSKAQAAPVIATLPSFARVLRYGVAAGALALVGGVSYMTWQAQQPHDAAPRAPEARLDAQAKVDSLPAARTNREVALNFDGSGPLNKRREPSSAPAVALSDAKGYLAPAPLDANARFAEQAPPARTTDQLGEFVAPKVASTLASEPAPPTGVDAYTLALRDGAQPTGGQVAPPNNAPAALGMEAQTSARGAMLGRNLASRAAGAAAPPGATGDAGGLGGGGMGAMGGGTRTKESLSRGLSTGKPSDPLAGGIVAESRDAAATPSILTARVDDNAAASESKLHVEESLREGGAKKKEALKELESAELAQRKPADQPEDTGRSAFFAFQAKDDKAGRDEAEGLVVRYYRKQSEKQQAQPNTAQFGVIFENEFKAVTPRQQNLSTFAVDVDTASYANVRRFLMQDGVLPPPGAVRVEEMINYFTYDYPEPSGDAPFSVDNEVTRCPWNANHWLLRVGLKARSVSFQNRKPANLVFLVDASGSMDQPAKMPLLKAGLRMLVNQLGENDKISIVTYANGSGVALPPTIGYRKAEILDAIDRIQPGGSTNGAAGINTAYDLAQQNFIKDGINRVLVLTDGDFNVGTTDDDSLVRMAEERAKTGVFLSTMGFGSDNLQDKKLEQIADKGNGLYGVVDNLLEARRLFVEQVGGTLVTVAKDVKIQVEFNPAKVGAYRQIGYENRAMAAEDFRNDAKDAGEIGSGHTVTALYELIPPGEEAAKLAAQVPASEFVKPAEVTEEAKLGDQLLTVFLRYKQPDGDKAAEIKYSVKTEVKDLGQASSDTKFASSVAWFGMYIRMSKFVDKNAPIDAVLELAEANKGRDVGGYRTEFIEIVKKAKSLLTAQ